MSASMIDPVTKRRASKTRASKVLAIAFMTAAFGLAAMPSADAHAHLEKAQPAVGGAVSAPPAEIRLWFSEPVEARSSSIEVTRADGGRIAAGATAAGAEPAVLVLKLGRPLAPGGYKVRWKAISVDSHTSEGSFGFEVAP